jgi:general transcription factor IIIA
MGCGEAFKKNFQLRQHVASTHSPPGTKAFQCEHEECTKSFTTAQKLKTHTKTHDGALTVFGLGAAGKY